MANSPRIKTPSNFVNATIDSFAFLVESGTYRAPKVSLQHRECTIVYWGEPNQYANIAVYHDLGSAPKVFIVPLWLQDSKGNTRSFELQEAFAVLAPKYEEDRPHWPEPAIERLRLECLWLDWYAHIFKAHLTEIICPSIKLLETIEQRRLREKT